MLLIAVSTFLCATFGVMSLYWLVTRTENEATQRLNRVVRSRGSAASVTIEESHIVTMAERVASPLQRLVPPSPKEAHKLQRKLMHAGYRSASASAIYRAIQLVALITLPIIVLFACLIMGRPINSAFGWFLFAGALGFLGPRIVLDKLIKKRQQLITWGMADVLDLMVVCIEAGLGLNAAMVRVSQELKTVHPDISDEFELANLEMRVGRERDEAFRNLAERSGVEDLSSFVAMLIQADRFGTSIAQAVRVYSDSMRTQRRQRAEQAAQKAAVKLLFPLACFLFPVLFIVILGPAAIRLMDSFPGGI